MKKSLSVFLLVMLLIPTYLMSQDTFYVSSTGDDSKLGTQTEPWKTLNVAQWTNGCTIVILDEVYLTSAIDVSKSSTLTEVTIKGNNSESSLAGLSDAEFEQGILNTSHFFDVKNGVKMNIQDITLKNINRTTGNGTGGMIYVNSGSELNIDNVVFKNSKVDVGLNCRGGAIWSAGKLSVKNSKFENCKAFEGGAVYLRGDAVLVNAYFENTIFKNNQTVNGTALNNGSNAAGAALYLLGKNFDVIFDKCYFDSNYAWNTIGNANGGGLRLQTKDYTNVNVNLTFSNCTMANNKSVGSSGFMTWARPEGGVVNLKFVNNVFYKNRTAGLQANILTAQKGDINAGLSGSLIFVNNTSIMNNTGADGYNLADQSAVNISDFGGNFDVIFVNNVLLDCMTEPFTASGTTVEKLGWGWTMREAGAISTGTYIIKNNLIDGIGGSANSNTSLQGFFYHFGVGADANNNKSYQGKTTEEKLSQAGISRMLSTSYGNIVPYIEINNNQGFVVDNGISSVLYKGQELIPQTDMRGVAISGTSKDLGAFELNSGISTGLEKNNYSKSFAYINSDLDELFFRERVASVQIYTISGICVNTINNAVSVNLRHLPKGVYILHIKDDRGNLYSQKIQK